MAGNSFGQIFRFTTWGESHGPAIGVVVDGVPPHVPFAEGDVQHWLDRRRPGQSRFTTQRQEPDAVKIGRMLIYDALNTGFHTIRVPHNRGCALCGDRPTIAAAQGG
jgi:chorismate synthase